MGDMIDFLKSNFGHVAPILLTGVFGLAIIFERTNALLWMYPVSGMTTFFDKLADLIMADKLSEAIAFCETYANKPAAMVAKEALLRAHQPEQVLRDGLEYAITEAHQKIQCRTPYLATIANVATLLGLLGTIMGLVQSFKALGSISAQQKAAFLANGISTAMNATMLGLFVAVPCLVAFSFLSNQTNKLTTDVEKSALRIVDLLNQRYFSSEAKEVRSGMSSSRAG